MQIYGPYKHRARWRVVTIRADGARVVRSFDNQRDAEEAIETFRRLYCGKKTTTVEQALARYETQHLRSRGCQPQTIANKMQRLDCFLGGMLERDVSKIDGMAEVYLSLQARMAVASHQSTLSIAKQFGRWLLAEGLVARNPWADIKPHGKPNKGKPQLRLDESRRFLAHVLSYPIDHLGATAAAGALLLGVRASELTKRTVRDLDDDGRVLVIDKAKTRAGDRVVDIPDVLRPRFLELCRDKLPGARLIPRCRQWVWTQVTRFCKEAGVPVVPPHGLRGTHSSLAVRAGLSPEIVARSLGHASTRMTLDVYATPEAHRGAVQATVVGKITGKDR